MLYHNSLNSQYLSLHCETAKAQKQQDAIPLRSLYQRFSQFRQAFPPREHLKPLLVYIPERYTINHLAAALDKLSIKADLPLDRYHLNDAGEYIAMLYIEDGFARRGQPPSDIAASTKPLTIPQGLSLIAAWPHILDNHAIDLVASRYSLECAPTVYRWAGITHLSAVCPDVRDKLCGAPTVVAELRFTCEAWPQLDEPEFSIALSKLQKWYNASAR